jgi:hypothetical protein
MDDESRKSKFQKIFHDDPFGLLDIKETPKQELRDEDWRLIEKFQEITQFYEDNNHRLPNPESGDISEYSLWSRLSAIKSDPKKVKILLKYDLYNLLESQVTKSVSLEEILHDDPLGLLESDDEGESIFKLTHVQPSDRLRPDYIARRKICKDFDMYEPAFKQIHADIGSGRRKLVEFNGQDDLVEGHYFVLRGVVFLLEADNATLTEKTYDEQVYRRKDGRTKCIFDNGTESTMLFRSLTNAMRIDGFGISDIQVNDDGTPKIEPDDVQNGYIYVLRSLSKDHEIRQVRNLYKIGYCSGDVTMRIQNAAKEPTYLMNDVEVVLTVRCYNLDVPKLEASIHRFFSGCNLDLHIRDNKGIIHSPREWFTVPLSVIEQTIQLIVKKEIEQYRYDHAMEVIIKTG